MILAADILISEGLFTALVGFGGMVTLALFGWVLTQAVTLGRIVARLEAADADHERRIAKLEQSRHGTPG